MLPTPNRLVKRARPGFIPGRVLAVLATAALAACSASNAGDTVKETIQTVVKGQKELDQAVRDPFTPKKPVELSQDATATKGAAAVKLDEVKLRAAIERFARDKNQLTGTYVSVGADLNGDGRPEALVYFTSESWCQPPGCPLVVLEEGSFGYKVVSVTNRVRPPILVSPDKTGAWRDLWVHTGRDAKGNDKGKNFVSAVRLKAAGNGYPGSASFAIDQAGKPAGETLIASATVTLPEKAKLVGMPGKGGKAKDDKAKDEKKP